jgi:IclR family transcriptional regulator, KDG regulon repressor
MPTHRTNDEAVDSGLFSPAVEKALQILEKLGEGGRTLSELSAALGMPKNAVFRITNTLRARGYLARDPRTLKFALTDKLIRVGQPRVEKRGLVETAMEPMRRLRDITKETVQIGVRSGLEGVILEQVEGLHPLRISVDPGLRFPLYNNAPGKLLLAHLPDRKAVIGKLDLAPCTPRTITDKRELERECARILELGWSPDNAESDEGINCLAAPILHAGSLVAVLWISGPSKRFPKSMFPEAAKHVMAAARDIGERLGC